MIIGLCTRVKSFFTKAKYLQGEEEVNETIYLTVVAVEHLKSFTHHSASIGLGGAAILVYLIVAVLGATRQKQGFP